MGDNNMKTYITKIKMRGIKCLKDEIELQFSNRSITNKTDVRQYNIKSIYGPNGSGKSAIIHAVNIYKNIILGSNFLTQNNIQKWLMGTINQNSKEFEISIEFVSEGGFVELNKKIYTHTIRVGLYDDNQYGIKYELLTQRNKSSNSQDKVIIELESGEVINSTLGKSTTEYVIGKMNNISRRESVMQALLSEKPKNSPKALIDSFVPFFWMASDLFIVMDDSSIIHTIMHYGQFLEDEDAGFKTVMIKTDDDYILNKKSDDYENSIKGLEKFIKLFKPDLKKIELEKKEDNDFYVYRKYFVYKDGARVISELESTGIRKLVKLYSAFSNFMNGKIVFIDELDANIHDVYLCALLDCFVEFGEGQLVFTTHNLSPMEILSKRKYGVDFISINREIVSYVKNGNYSALNLYKSGYISGSPFNINKYDFVTAFDGEDDE